MTDSKALAEIRRAINETRVFTGQKPYPWRESLQEKPQEAAEAANEVTPRRGPGRPKKTATAG